MPSASAMQAKIKLSDYNLPPDGISAANCESGDFGMSPFRGQVSGKPLAVSTSYLWHRNQSTRVRRDLNSKLKWWSHCPQFALYGVALFLTSRSQASFIGPPPRSGRRLRANWPQRLGRRKGLSVLAAVDMDHELGELTGIAGTLPVV